jgi:hypothetical protein
MIDTQTIPAQEARDLLVRQLRAITTTASTCRDLDKSLTRQQMLLLQVLIDVATKTAAAMEGGR